MSLISVELLKPGMVLEQTVYTPNSSNCLLTSGTALSIRNIQKLKDLGFTEVEVADPYTLFVSPNDNMAQLVVEDFIRVLRNTSPKRPEANKNDYIVTVAKQLETLIHKLVASDEVLSFLVQLRIINKRKLYDHSIYTAVLSGLVAGSMKLGPENVLGAILGGLLHNIGICEMPTLLDIEELSPQQENLWREHPTYGYYFALQNNIPRVVANAILSHHEKWNGSGYPKSISGEEIPILARIINVCSHYAESIIIEDMQPYMAVEELYGASGFYYDPKVVDAFVNNIPIYPLGVMVRLSTKEVGIVSNIRKNKGPRPIVKIYYNRVNRPISEDKIVDLGVERTIFIEEIL
ncbi:MAG: HD domain-containing protein [Lachnospiraceae bacterium]|nr:HD domain-containing protein [Lachnospiraceae bacterium]